MLLKFTNENLVVYGMEILNNAAANFLAIAQCNIPLATCVANFRHAANKYHMHPLLRLPDKFQETLHLYMICIPGTATFQL